MFLSPVHCIMRVLLSQLLLLLSHQAAQGLEAVGGCCPLIEISSRGQAARQQPQRLGVYQAQAGLVKIKL